MKSKVHTTNKHLNPEIVLQKVYNSSILKNLEKHSLNTQLITAKNVYNHQNCNIKNIIQQYQQQTRKLQQQGKNINTYSIAVNSFDHNKKTYQQNQHLQYIARCQIKSKRQKSEEPESPKFKKTQIKRQNYCYPLIIKKQRRATFNRLKTQLPQLKSRTINVQPISPIKIKIKTQKKDVDLSNEFNSKRNISLSQQNKSFIRQNRPSSVIDVTDEKMNKYLNHLKLLIKSKYPQQSMTPQIKSQTIEKLIMDRYQLQKKQKIINNDQYYFQLQYCDFSTKQSSRKTISQLINMDIIKSQNLGFSLYDFNHNGIIDEADIMNMIRQSQTYNFIENDLFKILRNIDLYLLSKNQNVSIKSNREQSYQMVSKQQSIHKQKNIRKFQNIISSNLKMKMFTFLETNQNYLKMMKKRNNQKYNIFIKRYKFQKIFEKDRPGIYYDLIKYLFNIDLVAKVKQLITEQNLSSVAIKNDPQKYIQQMKVNKLKNMSVEKFQNLISFRYYQN